MTFYMSVKEYCHGPCRYEVTEQERNGQVHMFISSYFLTLVIHI